MTASSIIPPCSFEDLPPPPAGRRGWPWTADATFAQPIAAADKSWPSISIVTPSYNHSTYLEETIRSVLLQGYPKLQYFVIDGGSTDDSVAVIRKYERWLSGWISEPDRGQSDALNKGFARSSGEIFNWICSDDRLEPGALVRVAQAFANDAVDAVVGDCLCVYEHDPQRTGVRTSSVERLRHAPFLASIWQPSCFFRRRLIRRPSLVREDLHYCMDRELWCYLHAHGAHWKHLPVPLSMNRFTGANKSVTGRGAIVAEIDDLCRRYSTDRGSISYWLRHVWLPLVSLQKRHDSRAVRLGCRLLSASVSLSLRLFFPTRRLKPLRAEYYGYELS